jgi:hypothetical protein
MSVPAQPGLEASIGSLTPQDNGAQSPVPSPAAFAHGASGERTFTEADLARVRKEEKDKLYSELDGLKASLKTIEEKQAQELAEATRKQQEKEAALQAKKEEEMTAKQLLEQKLKETNDTWESRFNQLQTERETERAMLAKERAYNELIDYRNSRLAEESADIAPQFHPFISGDNKEQIDNAIAQAKAATQSIAEEVAQARQQQLSQMRGVSTTGYTAMGPLEGSISQKQYSEQDIRDMPLSEWAKVRQETGIAASDAQRSRGLFG